MKTMLKIAALTVATSLAMQGSAQAATVNWSAYSEADADDARNDRALIDTDFELALEDFERRAFVPVPDVGGTGTSTLGGLATNVGTFTTTAGAKCGGSCDAPKNESLIRDTSRYGRYNMTDPLGTKWLDSNDNSAINLDVSGLGLFDRISLYLTDVDDVGPKTFSIFVDGQETDISAQYPNGSKPKNATLFLIDIVFDAPVQSSFISFAIDDGDGFGMDDVRIGSSIAPVPLPTSLPLLAAGIGFLGWRSRRRKSA
ncbi:MAG: PEP-CTERM sorting domain-containing protein [Pseudomonadota bacterium]